MHCGNALLALSCVQLTSTEAQLGHMAKTISEYIVKFILSIYVIEGYAAKILSIALVMNIYLQKTG